MIVQHQCRGHIRDAVVAVNQPHEHVRCHRAACRQRRMDLFGKSAFLQPCHVAGAITHHRRVITCENIVDLGANGLQRRRPRVRPVSRDNVVNLVGRACQKRVFQRRHIGRRHHGVRQPQHQAVGGADDLSCHAEIKGKRPWTPADEHAGPGVGIKADGAFRHGKACGVADNGVRSGLHQSGTAAHDDTVG